MSSGANLSRTIFCNSVLQNSRHERHLEPLDSYSTYGSGTAANLLMMQEPDSKKGKKKSKSSGSC